MACIGCDSAVEYFCTAADCRWSYIDGLNPRNPRSVENARKRPTWLVTRVLGPLGIRSGMDGVEWAEDYWERDDA